MKRMKITIIGTGISAADMPEKAQRIIAEADVLIGGKRLLGRFPGIRGEKIHIDRNISRLVPKLKKRFAGKKVAVLASGDPDFFGIAHLFCRAFNGEDIEIIPNITAFQEAFARIKEPWESARFISVHGRPLTSLDVLIRERGTYVVYCDNENTPARVAHYIIKRNARLKASKVWIFQNLGEKKEKVLCSKLGGIVKVKTDSLVMLIIKNDIKEQPLPLGIPDEMLIHTNSLITKKDVRLLAVSRLRLQRTSVLWDIGAGSGSLSIEAAHLYPGLEVYAIEKDEKRYKELVKNIRNYSLFTIEPVFASALDIINDLPKPDSVFIGGTGGHLAAILARVKRRIPAGGHVVVNCVTMETLGTVLAFFKKWRWTYEVLSAQHAYLTDKKNPAVFRAENPVCIVEGIKIQD